MTCETDVQACPPLKVLRAEFNQLRGSYYHFADKIEAKIDQLTIQMVTKSNQVLLALLAILGTLLVGVIELIVQHKLLGR